MSDELLDDEMEWGLGTYPPAVIQEPDMTRHIRIAEGKRAAQKIWDEILARYQQGARRG